MTLVAFLSGAAGLIFEIVWFYRCGLLFGNTVWATSIVLSSFMGGLALGNAVITYFSPRIRRFLVLYACLEAIVAVSGVALTYVLIVLPDLIVPATKSFLDDRWLVNLVRFGTAFPLLLVPTTAMGATLPALVGGVRGSDQRFGMVLGGLYGWNTFGAVLGVLAAELLLIEHVGITGSAWVAALLNAAAAGAALWLSSRNGLPDAEENARAAAPLDRSIAASPVNPVNNVSQVESGWRVLACAGLMGGTLTALEVVWFRFLSMFVVASTLAVSLMLAVVLAAIAAGGLVGGRWLNRNPAAAERSALVAVAAAMSVVGSYAAFHFLTGAAWAAEWHRVLWFTAVLTFPTAFLSGIAFVTLGAELKRRVLAGAASAAGLVTLANTTGGMVGPLVASFVLLPRIGVEGALFALAATYVIAAALAAWDIGARMGYGPLRPRVVAGPLAAAAALALFPFGLMARTYLPRAAATYTNGGERVVAIREGTSETIQLLARSWLEKPLYHRLVTNGYSMSGTHSSGKRYMRYFAYWPMVLHQGPLRRVLIVCYGVGVTAAAVESLDSVESIDVVEISPEITGMSDVIYGPAEHPLRDRRVRLHLEDGRYFLQATADRFDLITGEPPPPLTPGTVNLYTREYFQLIRDRLAEGGIATYWLPVARRGEYDEKAIIAAFCAVFDDCSLWNGTVFDWMLVGTRRLEGPRSASEFSAAWSDPVVWPRLREIGFEGPEAIGATFLADARGLRELSNGVPPVVDNYPKRLRPAPSRLSLLGGAPADVERAVNGFVMAVVDPRRARLAFQQSDFIRGLWPETLLNHTLPFFDVQQTVNRVMAEGARPLAEIEELHRLLTETTLRRVPLWMLGSDDAQQEVADLDHNDGSGMVEYVLGVRALVARQYTAAAGLFADAERRGLRLPTVRPLTVYALCLADQLDAARQHARNIAVEDADQRHFWTWMSARFGILPPSR